jgi:hypothetical protein
MGLSAEAGSALLGMQVATLSAWSRRWREDRLRLEARGRPAERGDVHSRNLVIAVFHLLGSGVGVPTLRQFFPAMARRELEELVRRCRVVWRRRGRRLCYMLRWKRAGTVWAMDFAEPPVPVDGMYGYILVVRDLGSSRQLLSLPVREKSGAEVAAALAALFRELGAPLVLKHDNDSAFFVAEVDRLLGVWGIVRLPSPPATPSYNGACEAGIGGLKTRAHHESARHGRPGEWTCDDVEMARLQANETARPWGQAGPTPDQAWRRRQREAVGERLGLQASIDRLAKEERLARGWLPEVAVGDSEDASIHRVAVSRALVELGYLEFRRRRITLPIRKAVPSNNS